MAIVTGDEEGIMRVYEYNPHGTFVSGSSFTSLNLMKPLDPDSKDGRHLLLRTEFHSQCEYHASALIARRTKDDPVIPQAKLMCGQSCGNLARGFAVLISVQDLWMDLYLV
jgi:cleavage and polyadenylation specificity factor subunit 1